VAPPAWLEVMGEHAQGDELFEGGLDPIAADMAVKKTPDLFPGQAVFGFLDGKLDAIGGEVTGRGAEEFRGTGGAILPYGEGGLEMGHGDEGTAIEGGVDGTEPEDLGFGPAGSGSEEARTRLAQVRVALFPKRFRGLVAAQDGIGCCAGPIEGLAQLMGNRHQLVGSEGAATG